MAGKKKSGGEVPTTPEEYEAMRLAGGSPSVSVEPEADYLAADAVKQVALETEARRTFLDSKRITATDLCFGASVSADTLTNYTRKQGLQLFSPNYGAGRARPHCLADVYTVATIARLASFGKTSVIVKEVWRHFALHPILDKAEALTRRSKPTQKELDAAAASYFDEVVQSVWNGPAAFHHRDLNDPFYLVLVPDEKRSGEFYSFFERDPDLNWFRNQDMALFVNLTFLFTAVDRRLYDRLCGVE